MRPSTLLVLTATLLCSAGLASASANAQDAPAAEAHAEARDLFDRGLSQLVEGRFPDARDLLRASFTRLPRVATAYNLVLALAGTEEPVEATALCARLLGGELGELASEQRAQVQTECDAAESAVAEIVVVLLNAPASTIVRLDGQDVAGPGPGPYRLRVDPRAHVVSAIAPGRPLVEQRVTVGRGGHAEASLRVPAAPGEDAILIGGLVGGGAAVLIAAGIVVGVLVSGSGTAPPPITDPVFGVVMALSF